MAVWVVREGSGTLEDANAVLRCAVGGRWALEATRTWLAGTA